MKRKDILAIVFILFAVVLGAAMRLSDSLPNFAPIGAIALFSGVFISRKWLAFALPLGALLLSDIIIEIAQPGAGFHNTMVFVYAAYALAVAIGIFINSKSGSATNNSTLDAPMSTGRLSFPKILGGALGASLLFFALTNFGVWLVGGLYSPDFVGLVTCYEMAIPFYRATLLSDVIYSGVFFGSFYLISSRFPSFSRA